MTIAAELHKLAPGAIVELYEIDSTALGGGVTRIHAGTNGLRQNVIWQGNTYQPFPIEVSGFEFTGKGQLPRPTVRVANVNGLMGALVRDYDDLLGAKFTRKRTLVKFLDGENFPDRRNQLLSTGDFSASPWTVETGCVVTPNAGLSPIGTNDADRGLFPNGTLARVRQSTSAVAGGQAVFSVWLKSATTSDQTIGIYIRQDGFGTTYAEGSVVATQEWQRFVITGTVPAATGVMALIYHANTSSPTADVLMWGAQLEVGTAPSAYQPVGATWSRNPTADPTAALPDDVFFVDRKAGENKVAIEWELAANFDVAGVQLPRRYVVQNVCPWKYRGGECGYTGTAYFDANDAPVGSAALDVCSKRLAACKARFGANNPLPFGGFPAAGLTR